MPSWTREIIERGRDGGGRNPRLARLSSCRPDTFTFDGVSDGLACIDFGCEILSLDDMARHTGIGVKVLRTMVRNGDLRPVRLPGSKRARYSAQQLAAVVKRYNAI